MNGNKYCQKCINSHYGSCNGCDYDGVNAPTKFIEVKQIPIKNINYENIPMETIEPLQRLKNETHKHDVTNKTLTTLKKVMLAQDEYGIQKYGKPLKHQYEYDWLKMFLEEIADGLKYIQNEIDRRESVINLLEYALLSDNPKNLIEGALGILKTEGTGK